jgi:hypothetical protein
VAASTAPGAWSRPGSERASRASTLELMDEDLTAARQAERRAADLHYVGWEVGAGATIWARVAQDALALHESAREKFVENTADLEAWERFHGSAFMLIVALAHVLGFERSVRRLTGDAERAKARARFDAACSTCQGDPRLGRALRRLRCGRGLATEANGGGSAAVDQRAEPRCAAVLGRHRRDVHRPRREAR